MPGFDGYDLWHNENGSITFQCTPNRAGTYKISVEFEGVPLTGLPVCCVVQKAGEGYVTAYKAGPEADMDIDLKSSGVDNVLTGTGEAAIGTEAPATDVPDNDTVQLSEAFDEAPDEDDDGGSSGIEEAMETRQEEECGLDSISAAEHQVIEQQDAVLLRQANGELLQAETLHIQPVSEDVGGHSAPELLHPGDGSQEEEMEQPQTAAATSVLQEQTIIELSGQYKEEAQEVLEGTEEAPHYQEIHYIQEGIEPVDIKESAEGHENGETGLAGAVAMEITDLPQEITDIKPIVDLGMVVNEGSKYILEKAPGDPNVPDGPIYVIKEQIDGGHIIMQPEMTIDHQPPPSSPEPVRTGIKRRRGRPANPRVNHEPILIGPNEVSLPKSFTESIKKSQQEKDDGVIFIGPNTKRWQRMQNEIPGREPIITQMHQQANQQLLLPETSNEQTAPQQEHQILDQRVLGDEEIQLIAAAESQELTDGALPDGTLTLMDLVGQDGTIVAEETDQNTTLLVIKNEQGEETANFVEDNEGNVLQVVEPDQMETDAMNVENMSSLENVPQDSEPTQDEETAKVYSEAEDTDAKVLAESENEEPQKDEIETKDDVTEKIEKPRKEPSVDLEMMSPARRSRRVAERKKTFKCRKKDCDEVFGTMEELEEHCLNIHKEQGTYVCPELECKRVFPTRKTYRLHLKRAHKREATDEEKIPCSIKMCGDSFQSVAKMKKHIEERHVKQEKKESDLEMPEDSVKKQGKPRPSKKMKDEKQHQEQDVIKDEERNIDANGDEEQEVEPTEQADTKKKQEMRLKRFMCEQCGRICASKASLTAHIETHSKQSRFKCDEQGCTKVFRNQKLLDVHKMRHLVGVWCTECNRPFKSDEAYQKHVHRVHEKPDPNFDEKKCPICGKDFGTKSAMSKHVQNIHHDASVPCPICHKVYRTKENMDRHRKSAHTDIKPFMCDLCGSFFKTKDILRCHREGMHRTEQVWETPFGSDTPVLVERAIRPFECKYCHRTFKRKAVMKEHVLAAHESTDEIPCTHPGCPKTFPTPTLMKTHVRSVHRIKEIRRECSYPGCDKWFNTKSALLVHENTHKNVRYQCLQQGCQFSFTTKHHMLVHYKLKHTNLDEKYACSICGKRFKMKEQVKAHLDCHKTERKYKCEVCGKGFTTQSRLTSHRKIHNVEGELECVYCGKTFGRKYRLQQHMAKHNAQEITVAYSIV